MPYKSDFFYEFGDFRLNPSERILYHRGAPVALKPKIVETLVVLVENAGELVGKEDLIKRLWQDVFVSENSLSVNIYALRKIFAEYAGDEVSIQTIPRRGFRLVAEVRKSPHPAVTEPTKEIAVPVVTPREISPEKLKPEIRKRKAVAFPALGPALVLLIFFAGAGFGFYKWQSRAGGMFRPKTRTIAVLPLRSLSDEDRTDAELRRGITDALTTKLAALPNLIVRPTSAARRFENRETDAVAAGRELKTNSILEGVLSSDGARRRITLQLVDVETGAQIWSGQFEHQAAELFSLQDKVSFQVAQALELNTENRAASEIYRRPTESIEAYQLYLRGRELWQTREGEKLRAAIEFYRRAIELDPNFVEPYIGLADTYSMISDDQKDWRAAEEYADRAVRLAPDSAEARATLGFILAMNKWQWPEAEREFKKAVELDPNSAKAHQWYGSTVLLVQRRFAEAETELKKAIEIDPMSPNYLSDLAEIYVSAGRFEEALGICRKNVELNPDFVHSGEWHVLALVGLGRGDEAMAVQMDIYRSRGMSETAIESFGWGRKSKNEDRRFYLETLAVRCADIEKDRDSIVSLVNCAGFYAELGDREKAISSLEKAFAERKFLLPFVNAHPQFEGLRGDAEFENLMRRLNLQGEGKRDEWGDRDK